MKAFLSHSSIDKDFVGKVAELLGRSRVLCDKLSFQEGREFVDSIRQLIGEARLFVLFASRASLGSFWVNFEIDEAEMALIRGTMDSALVVTIDPTITVNDLPQWMRKSLLMSCMSPNHAAQIIQEKLVLGAGLDHPFIGRAEERQSLEKQLAALGSRTAPRILLVNGLDGVGRRSLCSRVMNEFMHVSFGPEIDLDETHSLLDLHVRLLEETQVLKKHDLEHAIGVFKVASPEEKVREVVRLLGAVCDSRRMPVIVDHGALLAENGRYEPEFQMLLDLVAKSPNVYLVVIHNRYPHIDVEASSLKEVALRFKVEPLSLDDTSTLITVLLRNVKAEPTFDDVNSLALYVDGYPPAAYQVQTLVLRYGLPAVIKDKQDLGEINMRTFTGVLKKLNFTDAQGKVLRLLAGQPGLPLQAIAAMVEETEGDTARTLKSLIDLSLVTTSAMNYQVARPVRMAVEHVFGSIPHEEYARIARALLQTYWKDDDDLPPLSVVDATIHAMLSAGKDLKGLSPLVLPSTLHRAAKNAYDSRKWELARDLCTRTLQVDQNNNLVRELLFKALVRIAERSKESRDWAAASSELQQIIKLGFRSQYYLKGFLQWKQRNYADAVVSFRASIKLNYTPISVYRDLAECEFRLGHLDKAYEALHHVLNKPNMFVLDLAARIAIELGKYPDAEEYIQQLAPSARAEDLAHRRSTLYAKKKQFAAALDQANLAQGRKPPLIHQWLHRASVLTELSKYPEAHQQLDEVKKEFGNYQADIQASTRCKLLVHEGNWGDAELIFSELPPAERKNYTGIRIQMLRQKIADPKTSLVDRRATLDELTRLDANVATELTLLEESDWDE